MFQTFNFFKFEQLTFFNVFVEQLQFEQLTFCSKTCICSKWLFWGFSSSLIFFGICSNSVEQSRFWCRAVFSSRWISSSWPFSSCLYFTDDIFWYFLDLSIILIRALRRFILPMRKNILFWAAATACLCFTLWIEQQNTFREIN